MVYKIKTVEDIKNVPAELAEDQLLFGVSFEVVDKAGNSKRIPPEYIVVK